MSPEPPDRPTLATLAKEFGVSPTTVSNAFRRPDQLSSTLREKILDRAHSLGFYAPDPAGRLLRTGQTGLVCVALFHALEQELSDPHTVEILRGVSTVLDERGLGLALLANFGREPRSELLPFPVDALLVYSPYLQRDLAERLSARAVPILTIDAAHPDIPSINIEDRSGAREAARHLIALGHRRIAVLSFDTDEEFKWADDAAEAPHQYSVTEERLAGYREAFAEAGLDSNSLPSRECTNDEDAGYAATEGLLTAVEPPTAVLCMSDRLAFGCVRAVRERGLDVPRDVSVVGFDDVPGAAPHDPALTTVRQDAFRKGRRAALSVLSEGRPESECLPVELVVRASTGPPVS